MVDSLLMSGMAKHAKKQACMSHYANCQRCSCHRIVEGKAVCGGIGSKAHPSWCSGGAVLPVRCGGGDVLPNGGLWVMFWRAS